MLLIRCFFAFTFNDAFTNVIITFWRFYL